MGLPASASRKRQRLQHPASVLGPVKSGAPYMLPLSAAMNSPMNIFRVSSSRSSMARNGFRSSSSTRSSLPSRSRQASTRCMPWLMVFQRTKVSIHVPIAEHDFIFERFAKISRYVSICAPLAEHTQDGRKQFLSIDMIFPEILPAFGLVAQVRKVKNLFHRTSPILNFTSAAVCPCRRSRIHGKAFVTLSPSPQRQARSSAPGPRKPWQSA